MVILVGLSVPRYVRILVSPARVPRLLRPISNMLSSSEASHALLQFKLTKIPHKVSNSTLLRVGLVPLRWNEVVR